MYNILGFADAHWYPNVRIDDKYHLVRVAQTQEEFVEQKRRRAFGRQLTYEMGQGSQGINQIKHEHNLGDMEIVSSFDAVLT